MGDSATANIYRSTASKIEATLGAHYNGQFIYESTNRPKDSAVITALNIGYMGDDIFAPNSAEVAGTIETLNDVFNAMFPINAYDTRAGLGGVLYGRYEGDIYAGGNPWILSTAGLAQLYYDGAKVTMERRQLPSSRALSVFRRILSKPLPARPTYLEFARAVAQEGDDVLFRLRSHVAPSGFHLSEQLDKVTGQEISAGDLTWSYAALLKAMYYRTNAFNHLY